MKLAHLSDIHIDEHNRFKETVELLEWIATDIHRRQPDAVIIAGDSFPVSVRPSTPLERKAFRTFLHDINPISLIVIKGNHDVAEHDIDIFAEPGIAVFTQPWVGQLNCGHSVASVAALPWPSKAFLLKYVEESGKSIDELCREALKGILEGFRQGFGKTSGPRILIGHLNVLGASMGGFTPVGQDVEVTQEDLEATEADYVALGHIHKHQMFGQRIAYSGSPRRVDFGEEGEVKGYLLVEVIRNQSPVIEFVRTPCRPMQTITVDLSDPFALEGKRFDVEAHARLVLKLSEEDRATLNLPRILAQLGATDHPDLKIDYVVTPKQRVRSAEIQEAKTDAERLAAYLSTLEPKPGPDVISRLQLKFASLG